LSADLIASIGGCYSMLVFMYLSAHPPIWLLELADVIPYWFSCTYQPIRQFGCLNQIILASTQLCPPIQAAESADFLLSQLNVFVTW
jgi:hypothetical protein